MKRRIQSGFTLIELLVVVAILVALAGMVLPKLDRIDLLSKKGISANNAVGVARYIQIYKVQHNVYPDGWDSLQKANGTFADPSNSATHTVGIEPEVSGKFTPQLLTDKQAHSLFRMGIQTFYEYANDPDKAPGDQFTDTTKKLPLLTDDNSNNVQLPVVQTTGDGAAIYAHLYPSLNGAIPSDRILVGLGFGPLNTAIGEVLLETPAYANTDAAFTYNRHIAVFQVFNDGTRAELVTVLGADGDRIDEEIGEYHSGYYSAPVAP